MGESRVNEQILTKLVEMEKKLGFKQKLKDNAWTIGLNAVAPNFGFAGFAIDQQRRNIKKEKATGEKPKSLIERYPGTVGGAVAGALANPLFKMEANRMIGVRTSPAQLASEMVRGAAGGALGGALIVDPLTRWGTRKYYQHRDKEIEKAIRNRTQGGSLQKEAAYGDAVKALGTKAFKAAGDTAFRKLLQSKTKGDLRRAILQINAISAANKFVQENAKGITTGALTAGAGGALAGAGALMTRQREREKTASYYAVREMLGLDKEVSQAASAALQKEAAYGDTVKALGRKILGAAEDAAINKFLQSKTSEEFRRAGLRADAIRAANRFVQENAKDITTGALIAGTSGALAGARALITRQREREKTASYYAVREMLGLGKEVSRAASAALQKEAAYGDTVKNLGRKVFGAAADTAVDKLLQSKTNKEFMRAALRINAISAANRFVQENAKGITTGALIAGTGGALAGARALITRQKEREKTASYYAVREMLGLDKEASQTPGGTQQEISKRRRHQALEDAILENPRVKFRDLPPLQQVGTMVGGYYGARKLRALRRGNTWSPAADAILGAGIGASVGNLLGAIATDATIRHEEKASQKRK